MARTRGASKGALATQPPATLPLASPASSSPVPSQIRFPLLVVLSMALSSFLYAFASPFTTGDLSVVSRTRDQWWEVGGLLGWKAAQLAIGWYGGYDSTTFPFFPPEFISTIVFVLTKVRAHRLRRRSTNLPNPRPLPMVPHILLSSAPNHRIGLHNHRHPRRLDTLLPPQSIQQHP